VSGETVLALNAGSSSVKFALFSAAPEPRRLLSGRIEGIGARPALVLADAAGARAEAPPLPAGAKDYASLIDFLLTEVVAPRAGACLAVGHRVVHGGTRFTGPVRVDDAALAEIEALTPLARSHQPHAMAGIRAARQAWPRLPHVACFDTAFHRTLPPENQLFALPRRLAERGIRRYGFHGLSYEAIAAALPAILGEAAMGRVVVAHLGNGASLCGMVGLTSRHTTMGFTPLDGLVMGRRPGRLDPGVPLFLLEEEGYDAASLSRLLHEECGLLGLSGLSADMRDLLASDAPEARLAVEVFTAGLTEEIGAAAAAIGGLDALVFTGGIGENAAPVRAAVANRLAFLGARLDEEANARHATEIGRPGASPRLLVVPTDEERVIARHALALNAAQGR